MLKATKIDVTRPTDFPKLMQLKKGNGYKDRVVLFTSPTSGTVVHGPSSGYHTNTWVSSRFEDYYGEILLKS